MQTHFKLGTDVELVCRKRGQFVNASNYFKSSSSFGLDGNEAIAEIRSLISESPIDLTGKIFKILDYGHQKYPELEFYAGHYVNGYPIGGHLHFSLEPDPKIIEALDVVLGSLSNCIDDKQQRLQRLRCDYGKKGAYRKKNHGFEYRAPGSFLLSPAVTLVHFTLAKLAVVAVLEDNTDFVQLKERMHSCTFLRQLKNVLTVPDDTREGLKELDLLLGKKLNWDQDILPNWGIRRAA